MFSQFCVNLIRVVSICKMGNAPKNKKENETWSEKSIEVFLETRVSDAINRKTSVSTSPNVTPYVLFFYLKPRHCNVLTSKLFMLK